MFLSKVVKSFKELLVYFNSHFELFFEGFTVYRKRRRWDLSIVKSRVWVLSVFKNFPISRSPLSLLWFQISASALLVSNLCSRSRSPLFKLRISTPGPTHTFFYHFISLTHANSFFCFIGNKLPVKILILTYENRTINICIEI